MKKKVITLRPNETMDTNPKTDRIWYGQLSGWSVAVHSKTETQSEKSMKYWLYDGTTQVGAHGLTIKKAMENLRTAMMQRIKQCTDILIELDGISEFKLEENNEEKEN